jgi:hypothetical protein
MLNQRSQNTRKTAIRAICLLAAALGLSGCVVYPAYGPHWHPWHGYYYRY